MSTPTRPVPAAYFLGWLGSDQADRLLDHLTATLPWEQQELRMYGRTVPVPRLTCWVGDAAYTYSGISNAPTPWTPELADLRDRLRAATGASFNSVLCNLYRDGQDSVGWHSDDEPELGARPTIASLSLGATRTFKMRHEATREVVDFELAHGDLLVMRDESQSDWRHSVPRRARVDEPRLNLTFRRFHAP